MVSFIQGICTSIRVEQVTREYYVIASISPLKYIKFITHVSSFIWPILTYNLPSKWSLYVGSSIIFRASLIRCPFDPIFSNRKYRNQILTCLEIKILGLNFLFISTRRFSYFMDYWTQGSTY